MRLLGSYLVFICINTTFLHKYFLMMITRYNDWAETILPESHEIFRLYKMVYRFCFTDNVTWCGRKNLVHQMKSVFLCLFPFLRYFTVTVTFKIGLGFFWEQKSVYQVHRCIS